MKLWLRILISVVSIPFSMVYALIFLPKDIYYLTQLGFALAVSILLFFAFRKKKEKTT